MSYFIVRDALGRAEIVGLEEIIGAARARKPRRDPALFTFKYASRWGPVFGTPIGWLLTLAQLESSHDPRKVNMAVAEKGGAWGLMQQMADEAVYKTDVIRKFYTRVHPSTKDNWDPSPANIALVKKTLAKWRGRPSDLLDPDLNMMLASWQLGRLRRIFGDDLAAVAAAYHQGETAVQKRLDQGKPPVDPRLQPKGYEYVNRALNTEATYKPLLVSYARQSLTI